MKGREVLSSCCLSPPLRVSLHAPARDTMRLTRPSRLSPSPFLGCCVGHSGSLSTEWLPGWEGPPKAYAPRPLYRKSLWESRIEELRTMDMVAVTLGLSDVVAGVDPEVLVSGLLPRSGGLD